MKSGTTKRQSATAQLDEDLRKKLHKLCHEQGSKSIAKQFKLGIITLGSLLDPHGRVTQTTVDRVKELLSK